MVCCNLCKRKDAVFKGCTEKTKEDTGFARNSLRKVLNYCNGCWEKRCSFFEGTMMGAYCEQDFINYEKEKINVK